MKKIISATILVLALFVTNPATSYAAVLVLDPGSASVPVGDTFTVELKIDTEGESVTSADAVLNYNNTILSVESIEPGGNTEDEFFPELYPSITNNEIYIGASVQDPIDTKNGAGTIATITFKGKVAGTAEVLFDCTAGKTSDTNISKSDKNATDIVVCDRLGNGVYTVGSGIGQPPPPPQGTTPTATPTPMQAGSVETTIGLVSAGSLLLVGSVIARILLRA